MLTNTNGALVGMSLRLLVTVRIVVPTALAAMFPLPTGNRTRVIHLCRTHFDFRLACVSFGNAIHFSYFSHPFPFFSKLSQTKLIQIYISNQTMASIQFGEEGTLEIDGGVLEGVSWTMEVQ